MKCVASWRQTAAQVVLIGLLSGAAGVAADPVTAYASDLLERMSEALRTLNYEGVLVYSHDNQLESLHLVHRIEAGQVRERLMALNGPMRAVTREQDQVQCELPDGKPLSVKRPTAATGLLNTDGISPALILDHYRIELQGVARVAGREAEVVGIIPRDRLRYGYRFFIDREWFLPLKSDLIDQDGQSLEQLMFTSIVVDPAAQAIPIPEEDGLRGAPATETQGRWRFEDRPTGFQLVRQSIMDHPSGEPVEHFLFTDRLSAYSIYIEPDTRDGLTGLTHIGAVHAAGRQVDGYQVTAVGEVPSATVESAVSGVRLVRAASD
ncbi:MucB/RseB C-terminal domain-containing protein [Thiocapsa imhoffii]|nr:MucB/RseB C-terminal domain-containing protein [Thiocapsa imhoffii]